MELLIVGGKEFQTAGDAFLIARLDTLFVVDCCLRSEPLMNEVFW